MGFETKTFFKSLLFNFANFEAVPMGFETIIDGNGIVEPYILKQSLWDLKLLHIWQACIYDIF